MAVEIKRLEQTSFTYGDVVSLIHLAFQSRKDEGIFFSCADITVEEYREKLGDSGVVFVAYDPENPTFLLGTAVTHIRRDRHGVQYGFNELLAVHPDARRMGVASALQKERIGFHKSAGTEYMQSDTAVSAESSVKYHLKNGYRKIALVSFPQTDYYSYVFRRQLVTDTFSQKLYANDFYCRLKYLRSALRTKFIRRPDGEFTPWVKAALSLAGKKH